MSKFDCPRCGHKIPNDASPGAYGGALSRTDDTTEVCSNCGVNEALEHLAGILTPQEHWPVPFIERLLANR